MSAAVSPPPRKAAVVFDPARDPDPVPSPCVSACRISTVDGWCEGCTRTIDEIRAWRGWGDAERRAVWRVLPDRRAARLNRPSATADVQGQAPDSAG